MAIRSKLFLIVALLVLASVILNVAGEEKCIPFDKWISTNLVLPLGYEKQKK